MMYMEYVITKNEQRVERLTNFKITASEVRAYKKHYGDDDTFGMLVTDRETKRNLYIVIVPGKCWEMVLAHEVAHAIIVEITSDYDFSRLGRDREYTVMIEKWAWDMARTFCKGKYWDEGYAAECLRAYEEEG
jgi:hypothetical protein